MKDKSVIYFENLDGLRAIAALIVFFAHSCHWFVFPDSQNYVALKFLLSFGEYGGAYGVTFFFVLSGFLITYLLTKEYQSNSKINILSFYFRRVLRIWPLYYITLLIGFVFFPLLTNSYSFEKENLNWVLYACFLTNFEHIINGNPVNGILGVHWSVAIEEQFYLLWPVLFSFGFRYKIFISISLLLILLSESFLFFINNDFHEHYNFLSSLRFLAFGGILGYFCFYNLVRVKYYLNKVSKSVNVFIYLISFILLLFQSPLVTQFNWLKYFFHFFPLLFFSYVILEQNYSNTSFYKTCNLLFLSRLGKVSYGIYLIHMIAIFIVLNFCLFHKEYFYLNILISLSLTLIISYISYYKFESFFLKFKNRFNVDK